MSPNSSQLGKTHDKGEGQIGCYIEQGFKRLEKLWDDEDTSFSREIKIFAKCLHEIRENGRFGGIVEQSIARMRKFLVEIVDFSHAVVTAAINEELPMRRIAHDVETILGDENSITNTVSKDYKRITHGGINLESNILYRGNIQDKTQGTHSKTPSSGYLREKMN